MASRHALRQTIWYLRQSLGRSLLATDGDVVELSAPLGGDWRRFVAAIEQSRLAEALDTYLGEFLPGFAVAGGMAFEQWADAERQRLRLLFLRAAETLAREDLQHGRVRRAREVAARVRDTDPLDERGWRLLIEACLAQGDTVSALAEGERLEAFLADEHRIPDPPTRELLRRVAQRPDTPEPEDDGLNIPDLIGREREFGALVETFHRARRGTPTQAVVVARAGLGKTRLLQDVRRRLAASGATTVYVRAHPADRDIEWGYLAELARQLAECPGAAGVAPAAAASLVALEPSLSSRYATSPDPSTGTEARRRRLGAFADLIRAISSERPLALLLDDLHWADRTSRDALSHLPARLQRSQALFVGATRPTRDPHPFDGDSEVPLDPLTQQDIDALLATLARRPDDQWARALPKHLKEATQGSPLLILETLQLALETQCLTLQDGAWCCLMPDRLEALLSAGSALTRRIEQLERRERWLLLLLTIAGNPLELSVLADAAARTADSTATVLRTLEKRGLTGRAGSRWWAAHDEIAERVAALATAEQRRAAHAVLGRALRKAEGDLTTLRAAIRHLHAASLQNEVTAATGKWIRRARAAGDRRSLDTLVRDALGPEVARRRVRAVRTALPWTLWYRPWVAAAVAGMLLVAAAATVALTFRNPSAIPVIVLAAWSEQEGGEWALKTRRVLDTDLKGGAINLAEFDPVGLTVQNGTYRLLRPGRSLSVASTRAYPDSGGLDVQLTSVSKRDPRRLTFRRGDDMARSWSPDGRYLVIATDRWTDRSRTDLAIIDPARPESLVTRLTDRPNERDENPAWSPDGSRVAFLRVTQGDPAYIPCVTSVDAHGERCFDIPGYQFSNMAGWASPVEITGTFQDSAGKSRILAVHTATGQSRVLLDGWALGVSHAPGWVICFCRRDGGEPFQTMAVPVTHPERSLRIEPGDPPPDIMVFPADEAVSYLDRLRIIGHERPLPSDGAFRLDLRGYDAQGTPREPLAVRWTLSDREVADIDSTGVIRPRREGTTVVTATVGGWRSDTAVITFGPGESRVVVREDWSRGITPRWVPFGDPRPYIVRTPSGSALAPNGDSTFLSGVYLREMLASEGGVGIELDVSTPRTQLHWQKLNMRLLAARAANVDALDEEQGDMPVARGGWLECTVSYPVSESEAGWRHLGFSSGIGVRTPAPDAMPAGRWTTIRIQLFPDRRCGLAVDGVARVILDRKVPIGDSIMFMVSTYSHRTRFLIGRVEIWSGVRHDVNWGKTERR